MGDPQQPDPFHGLTLENDRYLIYKQTDVPLRDGHFVIHKTGNVDFLAKQLQFMTQKKFLLTDFQFGLSAVFVPNEEQKDSNGLVEAARAKDKVAEQNEQEAREREVAREQEALHAADHVQEVPRKRRKGAKTKLTDIEDPEDDKIHTHPLMEDCLLGIQLSIYHILVRLRDHFNVKNANTLERERCYMTLCHEKLETGIKVGNFNLHVEDPSRIADFITTRLCSFINSGSYLHLDLPLDESFQVRFTVSC